MSEMVRNQRPIMLRADATAADACRHMDERRTGAVLVTGADDHLVGIFTGRHAVRMLAQQSSPFARAALPKRRFAVAVSALSALLIFGPRQAQAYGDPAKGRQLATTCCSGCHQVDLRTQPIATDAVPSFQAIAAMPSTTSISIQAFLRSSHDVMPNFRLIEPQIDDVDAYILSQRADPPR